MQSRLLCRQIKFQIVWRYTVYMCVIPSLPFYCCICIENLQWNPISSKVFPCLMRRDWQYLKEDFSYIHYTRRLIYYLCILDSIPLENQLGRVCRKKLSFQIIKKHLEQNFCNFCLSCRVKKKRNKYRLQPLSQVKCVVLSGKKDPRCVSLDK